jgi:chromosome segregation ATPase
VEDELKIAAEVEALKTRMDQNDKRFDKIDLNIEKIWEKIDAHRESSIKTQTLVERLGKDLTESRMDNKSLFDKLGDKIDVLHTKMSTAEGVHSEKHANRVNMPFWAQAGIGLVALVVSIGTMVIMIVKG